MNDVTNSPIDWDQELAKGFAIRLIRFRAKRLVGHYGFRRADRPDIEQHLVLRLLKRRHGYDPTQTPWRAFVRTVVRQGIRGLIRHQKAKKRQMPKLPTSLSEPAVANDGWKTLLHQLVTADDLSRVTGCVSPDPRAQWELAQDLHAVIETLSAEHQELCDSLMQYSISDTARLMGIPRRTLRDKIADLKRQVVDRLMDLQGE